jgi:hypothetical protein
MTLGAKNQGASVVLMSLMVLGAIEGSTNTKADHPKSLESPPPMEPLHSQAVGGAAVLVSGRR